MANGVETIIPLMRPLMPGSGEVWRVFKASIDAGQFSNYGPVYHRAVSELRRIGFSFPVIVNSGTAAIRLALATSLPRGSRVLIPDYTHIGTLNACVAAGMIPVLGSCDKDTWTLSEDSIDMAASTCAGMVVVSPFGYRVDVRKYDELALKYGMKVIYDFAGGFGMRVNTLNPVCYSLHATKSISCGEGGICDFSDITTEENAMRYANFDTGHDRFIRSMYGDNLKAQELTCAVLLAHLLKLNRITKRIEAKRKLIDYYQARLQGDCVAHELHKGIDSAPSLAVLAGLNAPRLEQMGERHGVVFKRYYLLLSEMPGLSAVERVSKSSPYFRTCCALPSDVNQTQADMVIELIKSDFGGKR